MWPSDADIFAAAEPLIKNAEGFRAQPYLCPAGIPTIGWGATRYPGGRSVKLTDLPCSEIEAQVWLECAMRVVLESVKTSLGEDVSPRANQAAAMLSLAYNIGSGAFARSSVAASFKAADIQGAAGHFLDWDKAHEGGELVAIPGLLARREAERLTFLSDTAS